MITEKVLAHRTQRMGVNAIREILKVVSRPGMVSLAGGIPAPDSFPMDIMPKLATKVIRKYGSRAFQYDATEGFPPLREALSRFIQKQKIAAGPEEILISSGSQGVLDALGKVLISKGDAVAVESPTYLGAISAFNPYEPRYISIASDDAGLIPDALESALKQHPLKFVYSVPTFQNPTGRTIPLDRRTAIAEIIQKYNIVLIEDDPYSFLRYRGDELPPLKTLAPDHVVYVNTLSKVFAPGLRIGFCIAPACIQKWLVTAKQGVDLHTGTFNQALAAEYIDNGHLEKHLPTILALYKPKQAAMLQAMSRFFPAAMHWSEPDGGMFIWATGPGGLDMDTVYRESIRRNTAFVPGRFFFTRQGEGLETMRLNFTMADEATIERAIETLSLVIREQLEHPSLTAKPH